jgi:hypothetical protein
MPSLRIAIFSHPLAVFVSPMDHRTWDEDEGFSRHPSLEKDASAFESDRLT